MVERSPLHDPGAYLESHLEPQLSNRGKNAEEAFQRTSLVRPGFEYRYGDTDEFEERVGDRTIRFSTALIDPEFKERLRRIAREQEKGWVTDQLFRGNIPVRLVRSFEMIDEKRGSSLKVGSPNPSNPNVPFVFLRPVPWGRQEHYTPGAGLVVADGDLTKLETVAALFHELGHVENNEHRNLSDEQVRAMNKNYRGHLPTKIDAQTGALVLEDERRAWSYALSRLHSVLSREELGLVIDHAHHHALDSYSQSIRERLAGGWLVRFSTWLAKVLPDRS